jgi:hypothetical protein
MKRKPNANCPHVAEKGFVSGFLTKAVCGGWVVIYDRQKGGPSEFARAVHVGVAGYDEETTGRFIVMHRPSGRWAGYGTAVEAKRVQGALVKGLNSVGLLPLPESTRKATPPQTKKQPSADVVLLADSDEGDEEKIEAAAADLNEKQLRFVHLRIEGRNKSAAYREAGYRSKTPEVEASLLSRNPKVSKYYNLLAAQARAAAVLTRHEVLAFCASVMRAPLSTLPPDSPLIQEVKRTRRVTGQAEGAEEWETEQIKLPGKLEAGKLAAALEGWNASDKALDKTQEAVSALSSVISNLMESKRKG